MDLADTLFIGVVAALAIAFGLAFGLGGRDVAGQVAQDWYRKSQAAAARVQASSTPAPASGTSTESAPPTDPAARGTARPAPRPASEPSFDS